MARKDPLRELLDRFPAPPELKATMEGLRDGYDYPAAIIAASIVESILERLLIQSLKKPGERLLRELFGRQGPLSDFRSKILLAEAVGCIFETQANELNRIRRIRNAFAHARQPLSFNAEEIEREVDRFEILKIVRAPTDGFEGYQVPAKRGYIMVCEITAILLNAAYMERGGESLIH